MKINNLIMGTAFSLCAAHFVAGGYGSYRVDSGEAYKKHRVPASALLESQKISIKNGFITILKKNDDKSPVILSENHCDLRITAFLSDSEVLRSLSEAGIRRIHLELPSMYQKKINAVANGDSKLFRSNDTTDICGSEVGEIRDQLITNLILSARKYGIKIYASDKGNGILTALALLNWLAADVESDLMKAVGLKTAAEWWDTYIGSKLFLGIRMNDMPTVDFVKDKTGEGHDLILRGLYHIIVDGPRSLRANFPGNISFGFNGQENTASRQDDVKADGLKFNPPDYVIDLNTATVGPYPQVPGPLSSNAPAVATPN